MSPSQVAAALASFSLAVLAGQHASLLRVGLPAGFSLVAYGAAAVGTAIGWARRSTARTRSSPDAAPPDPAGWLIGAALAAGASLLAANGLPRHVIVLFLLQVALIATPFAAGIRGLSLLHADGSGPLARHAGWLVGAITGSALASSLSGLFGGPLGTGWLAAAALAITGSAVRGKRKGSAGAFGAAGIVLAVCILFLVRPSPGPPGTAEEAVQRAGFGEAGAQSLSVVETRWRGGTRTDLLTAPEGASGFCWFLTEGAAPVPVTERPTVEHDPDWWMRRFPLLAIPLLLNEPHDVLTAGTIRGSEIEVARALEVSSLAAVVTNPGGDAWRAERTGLGPPAGKRLGPPNGEASLDLVLLPVNHTDESRWPAYRTVDASLLTVEALRTHWQALRPGGLLAVTTSDERLFVRALLTAWEALVAESARTQAGVGEGEIARAPFAQRAWGLRLRQDAPLQSPYRFLLLLPRNPPDLRMTARLRGFVSVLPVNVLFGSGYRGRDRYATLETVSSPGEARAALRHLFSARAESWLELRPATRQRGFFFGIVSDFEPRLKFLLATCVLAGLAVSLFPLSARRRVDCPAAGESAPLPVLLAPFGLLGAGFVLPLGGTVLLGAPEPGLVASLAPLGLGLGLALGHRRRAATGAIAGGILLAAAMHWFPPPVGRALFAAREWGHSALAVAAAGGFAWAAGAGLGLATRQLERQLPALLPWGWVLCGTTTLGATPLVPWLVQGVGWRAIWATSGACFLLAALILAWTAAAAKSPRASG